MLSPRLPDALRAYWRYKRPRVYLFPSSSGHRGIEHPISDKTIWNVSFWQSCMFFRQAWLVEAAG
jgi:hypothetical protein